MNSLCMEQELQELMQAVQMGDGTDLERTDQLISRYPGDPRLHFLRGSILASVGRPLEALPALRQAVELAPDFAIARFQLGFFQLTSGEAADALSTWGPLALLPDDHYLRRFVAGLTYLIRDEFTEAERHLREGIAANQENPPLNHDMQLIMDQMAAVATKGEGPEGEEAQSATSFLLNQLTNKNSLH